MEYLSAIHIHIKNLSHFSNNFLITTTVSIEIIIDFLLDHICHFLNKSYLYLYFSCNVFKLERVKTVKDCPVPLKYILLPSKTKQRKHFVLTSKLQYFSDNLAHIFWNSNFPTSKMSILSTIVHFTDNSYKIPICYCKFEDDSLTWFFWTDTNFLTGTAIFEMYCSISQLMKKHQQFLSSYASLYNMPPYSYNKFLHKSKHTLKLNPLHILNPTAHW